MVGMVAGDDFHFLCFTLTLPVKTRRFYGTVVRYRTAGREKSVIQFSWGQLTQPSGQFHGRQQRRPGITGEIPQFSHLSRSGLTQFTAAMTNVDIPEAGQTIDVRVPIYIGDGRPVSLHIDHRIKVVLRMLKRVNYKGIV